MNYIFYHLFHYNDAVERFLKTLEKIKMSRLYDNVEKIYVNVVATDSLQKTSLPEIAKTHSKIALTNISIDPGNESDTLKLLWDTCQQLNSNDNILYLHSKGVSRVENLIESKNIQGWIDLMEYFLIEQWQQAIEKLQDCDACGVNLITKEQHPHPHFSGNFWWASNAFIKKTKRWCVSISNVHSHREFSEFWLLDPNNVPNNKPFSLHNSGVCHYGHYYEPSNYRK